MLNPSGLGHFLSGNFIIAAYILFATMGLFILFHQSLVGYIYLEVHPFLLDASF